MDTLETGKFLTKAGVISLAALAGIGIVFLLMTLIGVDFYLLEGSFLESCFFFIFACLWIAVGFCFPAALLISLTSIAWSMKENSSK
jgi:hypothetical protein